MQQALFYMYTGLCGPLNNTVCKADTTIPNICCMRTVNLRKGKGLAHAN